MNIEEKDDIVELSIKIKDLTENLIDYDTLVLSGGSVHSIIMLGAIQYLYDNNMLKNINNYVGTSAGAICGYLLAIGYTPIDVIVYLCTKQVLEQMKYLNIVAIMNGYGAISYSYLNEQLEKMTIEKIGRLLTLKELYSQFGKRLCCITYNLTDNKTEIIDYTTYPDMPCLIALRMTSNLPFIFDNFSYQHKFYTDGGISNNFPIDVGDKIGKKVYGITFTNMSDNFSKEPSKNILEHIYQLSYIPIYQSTRYKIDNIDPKKFTIIELKPDKTKFFDFNLDSKTKLNMFSYGFSQIKEYYD